MIRRTVFGILVLVSACKHEKVDAAYFAAVTERMKATCECADAVQPKDLQACQQKLATAPMIKVPGDRGAGVYREDIGGDVRDALRKLSDETGKCEAQISIRLAHTTP